MWCELWEASIFWRRSLTFCNMKCRCLTVTKTGWSLHSSMYLHFVFNYKLFARFLPIKTFKIIFNQHSRSFITNKCLKISVCSRIKDKHNDKSENKRHIKIQRYRSKVIAQAGYRWRCKSTRNRKVGRIHIRACLGLQ